MLRRQEKVAAVPVTLRRAPPGGSPHVKRMAWLGRYGRLMRWGSSVRLIVPTACISRMGQMVQKTRRGDHAQVPQWPGQRDLKFTGDCGSGTHLHVILKRRVFPHILIEI